jgi:hypothetical protein
MFTLGWSPGRAEHRNRSCLTSFMFRVDLQVSRVMLESELGPLQMEFVVAIASVQ